MKFLGLPMGMWLLFHRSFRKKMVGVLGFDERSAEETEKKALLKYKEIIAGLPEFEKADRFKMNIVNCAMLSAFYLNMEKKLTLEQMTKYYEKAMMNRPDARFLPDGREKEVQRKGRAGHEGHGGAERCRPESLFLEYGVSALSGRKRL